MHTLLNSTLCNLDLTTSDTCDLDALEYASDHPEIFKLVRLKLPALPCFFLISSSSCLRTLGCML